MTEDATFEVIFFRTIICCNSSYISLFLRPDHLVQHEGRGQTGVDS